MKAIIAFLVLVTGFTSGYGIKCYESACMSTLNGGPPTCIKPQHERTCAQDEQCMTQTMTMTMNMGSMIQTARNCTKKMACLYANQTCALMVQQGIATDCKMECCSNDLCNADKIPPQKTNTTKPIPSGSNLTCYLCFSGYRGHDDTSTAPSCDKPVERKCASPNDPASMFNDRCLTMKMKGKDPNSGKIVDQEVRNCSSSFMNACSSMCKTANSTGELVSCDVNCCVGNKCNGIADTKMSTTTGSPTAGAGKILSAMASMVMIFGVILAAVNIN